MTTGISLFWFYWRRANRWKLWILFSSFLIMFGVLKMHILNHYNFRHYFYYTAHKVWIIFLFHWFSSDNKGQGINSNWNINTKAFFLKVKLIGIPKIVLVLWKYKSKHKLYFLIKDTNNNWFQYILHTLINIPNFYLDLMLLSTYKCMRLTFV